jgi:hypothetical protein
MTDIRLTNTDQDDLYVVVWDLNQPPDGNGNPPVVQPAVRLNQGQQMTVSNVVVAGNDHIHIQWQAKNLRTENVVTKEVDSEDTDVNVTTFFG